MQPSTGVSRPAAPIAWAVMSFTAFVMSLFGAVGLLGVVRIAFPASHLAEIAAWSILWGIIALIGVVLAARVAFGRWLTLPPVGLTLAAAGIGISATVHVVLQQWAEVRFGYYDAEFVGWSAGLFVVLVGLSVSAFGVFLAPRGAAWWPLAFVVAGALGVLIIALNNFPGIRDGLAPESGPLAAWLAISTLYALVAGVASVMRARAPEPRVGYAG